MHYGGRQADHARRRRDYRALQSEPSKATGNLPFAGASTPLSLLGSARPVTKALIPAVRGSPGLSGLRKKPLIPASLAFAAYWLGLRRFQSYFYPGHFNSRDLKQSTS